ncbi:MAG: DUF4175 family protein, partial [Verrucomicrobiota bacterium]
RPAARLAAPALALLAAGAVICSLIPDTAPLLLRRVWLSAEAPFTRTKLVVEPGDADVALGASVTLLARTSGAIPDRAVFEVRGEEGGIRTFDAAPSAEAAGAFPLPIDNVQQSFRYRVLAGDARGAWHTINVLLPPVLADLAVTIEPPAYTGLPVTTATGDVLNVPAGSTLRLAGRAAGPLQDAHVALWNSVGDAAPATSLPLAVDDTAFSGMVPADSLPAAISIRLHADNGLYSQNDTRLRLRLIPDQRPVIALTSAPADGALATPTQNLRLAGQAADDYGVTHLSLRWELLLPEAPEPLVESQDIELPAAPRPPEPLRTHPAHRPTRRARGHPHLVAGGPRPKPLQPRTRRHPQVYAPHRHPRRKGRRHPRAGSRTKLRHRRNQPRPRRPQRGPRTHHREEPAAMNIPRHTRTALAAFLLAASPAAPAVFAQATATPETLADGQQALNRQIADLATAYRILLNELRDLGAAREDIATLEAALATLANLHSDDIPRIVALLQGSDLDAALNAQKQVAGILRDLSIGLQQRQQELALATQARSLALRQAANRRRTDALRLGAAPDGVKAFALAEQDALRSETLALLNQVERLRQDPSAPPSETLQRIATPEFLAGLRSEAARAAERTRALDYRPAIGAQLLVQDRLQMLSALGRAAISTAEAARLALREVESLLAEQQKLRDAANVAGTDPGDLGWSQDKLTARADALRPEVDALSAAAGNAIREAADAMHDSRLQFAQVRSTRVLPAQDLALARLNTAREHLLALATTPPPPRAAEADKLRQLAQEAESLKNQQEALNKRTAATPENDTAAQRANEREQADLARRTAELQRQTRETQSEAADDLGQAASRMAESNAQADTNPAAADAAAESAADHLAEAADQLAQDAAQAAQDQAAAQVAAADQQLQNAEANLDEATNASSSSEASQAAADAAQALQQARAALAQSAQGAPSDAQQRAALSEAWQAVNEAAAQAAAGNIPQAQAATQKAREALAQVQQATSGAEGSPDDQAPPGMLAGQGEDAAETLNADGLTPEQRDAVAAARRSPVPPAYANLIESYYDLLNEPDQ